MHEIENKIKEIIQQLNEFRQYYLSNEQAVRTQLIEPILNVLGWTTSNPKIVKPNAPSTDGKIPDYTLLKDNKATLIVEAKNLSIDLNDRKIIEQLANYCYHAGIHFGILSNGLSWLLFKTFENNPSERVVWQINIEKDKIENVVQKLSLLTYTNIDALDNLIKNVKLLDDSWQKICNTIDDIVKIIAQKLLDNIKTTEPNFKIDESDLLSFTKGKLEEFFELSNTEDEEKPKNEKQTIETELTKIEDKVFKRRKSNKPNKKISVTFPDGTILKSSVVAETFAQTIQKIGLDKVKSLGIIISRVPLIAEEKHHLYQQYPMDKYWIMTNISTMDKFLVLKRINEELDLNLKIEIFNLD